MIKKIRKLWHSDYLYNDKYRRRQLDNIYAYQRNEFLKNQNINYEDFEEYQYISTIHKLLEINQVCTKGEFQRLGKRNDGGYLMWNPISQKNIAYSIGISTDVSWDVDMAKKGYEVFLYDHTIKKLPAYYDRFHFQRIGITGGQRKGT